MHKCVYGLFKDISSKAAQEFKAYAKCLDYNDLAVPSCKKQQAEFEKAYYGAS